MKDFSYIVLIAILAGCLEKPSMWIPPGELGEGNDLFGEAADQQDGIDGQPPADRWDIDMVELCATDQYQESMDGDLFAVDIDSKEDLVEPDAPQCPSGYAWSEAQGKCVSFCSAEQYYEIKVGKCVYYPCCDLAGSWELSVYDNETSLFTIYNVGISQDVSYLSGQMHGVNNPEKADCAGLLENKKFSFNCISNDYVLALTSGTTLSEKVFGFYSYQYNDGTFKNGSFSLKKL